MNTLPAIDLADPRAVRRAIRDGSFREFTNRVAGGFVQGNLVIVPESFADDFEAYCRANAQALPILGRSAPGCPHIPSLAEDLDLRTDVGEYLVFREGEIIDRPTDISDLWRDDLVAFVLGCSFSFEGLLVAHGVRLRHLEEHDVSAMYVTDRDTVPVGRFAGKLVVSMRALTPAHAITATIVSDRYPLYHGRPVSIGLPEDLGITDLSRSYGGHGMTRLEPGEIPVFWACGATGQIAVRSARLPFCITHNRAHMVLTDIPVDKPS
jgi:uncharacterized protein YcsI (UPF0317 family)